MKLVSSIPNIVKGDWNSVVNFAIAVQKNINKLSGSKLGPEAGPTFASFTLTGLTANRLIASDADKALTSTTLNSWIAGTTNRVTVADDGDGTVTLSAPQDLHTGATPQFAGMTLTGPLNMSDSHISNLGYVDWDLTSDGTAVEGRMYWNSDDGTLNLGMPGGDVVLQLGQEEIQRVQNDESDTITNGTIVYISGSTGDRAKVKRADASSMATSYVLGMATEDIASSQFGYVTSSGLVRDVNTSGMTYGVPIWLSATAGQYTQTMPTAPDVKVFIGYPIRIHATEGVIIVRPTVVPRVSMMSDVYGTPSSTGDFAVWDNTNQYYAFTSNISDFQLVDQGLTDIAGLTPTDGNIIVGDGTNWVAESGATARTSLGLGTTDSPTFGNLILSSRLTINDSSTNYLTRIGYQAGENVSGSFNTMIGYQAGKELTTGTGNVGIGMWSCGGLSLAAMTGTDNLCIGTNTGQALISGSKNIFLGTNVGRGLTDATGNVCIGYNTLRQTTSGLTGNVRIGFEAGHYDVNSNRLIIDNQDRGNAAGELANALLYGVFAAAAANQTIRVNGKLGVGLTPSEQIHSSAKVRADTAFNLNGTDGVTQAASAGKVCDVTALAGGIATAQTQITYATDGTYNFDATSGKVSSITITNGRITAITTA